MRFGLSGRGLVFVRLRAPYMRARFAVFLATALEAGRLAAALEAGRLCTALEAGRFAAALEAGRLATALDAGRLAAALDSARSATVAEASATTELAAAALFLLWRRALRSLRPKLMSHVVLAAPNVLKSLGPSVAKSFTSKIGTRIAPNFC